MYKAVIEGASCAVATNFQHLTQHCEPVTRIGVTGSGVNSRYWLQLLADLTGNTLEITDASSEGRGAAVFFAVATGLYPDVPTAIDQMVKPSHIVEPGQNTQKHQQLLKEWQAIDTLLTPVNQHLSGNQ